MRTFWTDAQLALLIEHYPSKPMMDLKKLIGRNASSIYNKSFELGLKKSAEYLASGMAGRTDGQRGLRTRFQKGHVSWNKGKPMEIRGRMQETMFKKGQVPKNYKPVGTIRVVDGYQEIKVAEGMRQWKQLHRVVWERLNGAIPKGMNLIFRDGNKSNISIVNLELMTKAQNMKRNSYHENYPKEIQLAIQLKGALTRQINKRKNHEQH
jgi:hypothetical protein